MQLLNAENLLIDPVGRTNPVVAYVLWGFLGLVGGHRLYLGTPLTALLQMICTLSIIGLPFSVIWWLVDAFLIPSMVKRSKERSFVERLHTSVRIVSPIKGLATS